MLSQPHEGEQGRARRPARPASLRPLPGQDARINAKSPAQIDGPRAESQRTPWGPREIALGILTAVFAYVVIAGAIAYPAERAFGKDTTGALIGGAVAVMVIDLAAVAVVYALVRSRGGGWRDLGLVRPSPLWPIGTVIAAFIGALVTIRVYLLIVGALGLDLLEPSGQVDNAYFEHPWSLPVLGIAIVGVAPFSEELFFRGFIFGGLRPVAGLWPAAFLSGLIFAVPHAQLGLLVPFGLIGVIFAYTYSRTGSIFTSMSVHLLFNLLSFTLLLLFPGQR